jgi:signal peptide peptidase SppA
MQKMRAFTLACSTPWAITPEALRQILEISAREHIPDFEAVEAKKARRVDQTDTMTIHEGGVAILPIIGPIFRYANLFTEYSGGAAVSSLARDFNTALSDPSVKAIILNIDSPGGEITGIGEFAQMVFDGRAKKPIKAYVGGLGASAAYWIASAAGEIIADATAMLGSIGVVAAVPNPDKRSSRDVEFVSSQSPRKRPNPNTESGKGQIQAMVDDLAAVFVGAVAKHRAVSTSTVLEKFGQGDVFVGRKAVAAGLADRLGSFEQIVSELASGKSLVRYKAKVAAVDPVAENKRLRAELAAPKSEPTKAAASNPTIETPPSPAPMTDARRRELLGLTPAGRLALNSKLNK